MGFLTLIEEIFPINIEGIPCTGTPIGLVLCVVHHMNGFLAKLWENLSSSGLWVIFWKCWDITWAIRNTHVSQFILDYLIHHLITMVDLMRPPGEEGFLITLTTDVLITMMTIVNSSLFSWITRFFIGYWRFLLRGWRVISVFFRRGY